MPGHLIIRKHNALRLCSVGVGKIVDPTTFISSSQKTEDHEMGMATCTLLVFFYLSSEWFVSYTTIVGNKFHNGTPITLTKVGTQKSNIIQ